MSNFILVSAAEEKVRPAGLPLPSPGAAISDTGAVEPRDQVNILLVDDEPTKLITLELILSELGENLIKASSGREALQLLLKREFAVILLDIKMPDIDGFEIAAMIRERPSLERIPIIFLTAYSTSDLDRLRGYGIGAVDYLFLPVVPDVLKAKVRVFVELAKQTLIIKRQAERLSFHNQQQQEQIRLIQELNGKLEAANEELESFSYSVSHDLRSPLRAMQGYAQILLEDFQEKLGAEAKGYLERINRAAIRMDALVRDVLAYSQVARAQIRTNPVDLEALLASLIRDKAEVRRNQARITLKSPLLKVNGNEACLTQCFSNLLDNAVKFVREGTVPEIVIWTELRNPRVRIWVEDNGIGIDPPYHARIFQMFERLETEQRYEGTGIGLAIVKKAVERMGGTVGVESKVGDGSRFWVELPQVLS